MLTSLILSSAIATSSAPRVAKGQCRAALQLRSLNIPVSRSDASTEIVHAVLVDNSAENTLAIFLVLRNGDAWAQWVARERDDTLARILGMKNPRATELRKVDANVLERIVRAGYQVDSCY